MNTLGYLMDALNEPASATTHTVDLDSAPPHTPQNLGPIPPQTLQESGLPFSFLLDLLLKILFNRGQLRLWQLSEQTCLMIAVLEPLLHFMRSEHLCEVARRGCSDADISYQLTSRGRERAEEALRRSLYAAQAPVSLSQYIEQVELQRSHGQHITRQTLMQAFAGIVLGAGILDQLGSALNSGRAVLLYGPSGSGKTYLAEQLCHVLKGMIYVPHAFLVDHEVIQVFDPLIHQRCEHEVHASGLERWQVDRRWIACDRPVVMTGGELTLSLLDLQFDEHTRFYIAPPQVKANNGLFIIDDLGRQLVSPHDLMNRWIVPMDRHVDHYALHTGLKFRIPFDVNLIFSTNLQPAELSDPAFLRRLGYKIRIGEIGREEFREILAQACHRVGVAPTSEGALYLLHRHAAESRPLLACTPYDLVSKLRDYANYFETPAEMTNDQLAWAWENYFADT